MPYKKFRTQLPLYAKFLQGCRKESENPETGEDLILERVEEATKIPYKTYQAWEKGRRRPRRDQLIRLIELFSEQGGLEKYARVYQKGELELVNKVMDELGYAPIKEEADDVREKRIAKSLLQKRTPRVPVPEKVGRDKPVTRHKRQNTDSSTKLVGRTDEIKQLRKNWRQALKSNQRCVLVEGEAGIGKTALVNNLSKWVDKNGGQVAWARCRAIRYGLPYDSIIQLLRDPLRSFVEQLEEPMQETLNQLLSVTSKDFRVTEDPQSERSARQRRFEAFAYLCLEVKNPLLLVFDDMQWCDGETIDCITYLLQYEPEVPLLIIGIIRSEDVSENYPLSVSLRQLFSSGQMRGRVEKLKLGLLSSDDTIQLAELKLKNKGDFDQHLVRNLLGKCSGHPLLITELLNEITLQGRINNILPTEIQSLIEYRLGSLSPQARELVNLATTFGTSFTVKLLQSASGWDEINVTTFLDELWRKCLIRELNNKRYDIIYDLFRETIYRSISPVLLPFVHKKVAHALETIEASNIAVVSGQIAHHFEQAGMLEEAIRYYQRAAEYARNIYAFENQILNLDKALQLLQFLPATFTYKTQKLSIYTDLIGPLIATKGYAAPDVIKRCDEAQLLCEEMGATQIPLAILSGLSTYYMICADFAAAKTRVMQLIQQAEDQQNLAYAMDGRFIRGVISFHMGQFREATEYLQPDNKNDMEYRGSSDIVSSAQNPVINRHGYYGVLLWYQGFPEKALTVTKEAKSEAEKQASPYVKAMAMFTYVWVCYLCGEWEKVIRVGNDAMQISKDNGIDFWYAVIKRYVGATFTKQQNLTEGFEWLHEGSSLYEQAGAKMGNPLFLCFEIEAYLASNQRLRAIKLLKDVEAMSLKTQERFADPEIYRLKGVAELQEGNIQQAEILFKKSIEIAQSADSRSFAFELRSVISLCELWHEQGKNEQAYKRLEEVYTHFTEGFETADLKKARNLYDKIFADITRPQQFQKK